MRSKLKGEYYDSGFLLAAMFVYVLSALVMLIIFTVLLSEIGCSERSLGYASSAISFLAAAAAGIAAAAKRKAGTIYTALLTSSVLVTTLLTIGFLVNGSAIEPSAVMSVISFSFCGCMVATLLYLPGGKKNKKIKPSF